MSEQPLYALVRVRVQPGARSSEIAGFREEVLQVKVSAPAREGRANEALLRLLAEKLGVRRARVSLVRGAASRDKIVRVDGVSDEELAARLG